MSATSHVAVISCVTDKSTPLLPISYIIIDPVTIKFITSITKHLSNNFIIYFYQYYINYIFTNYNQNIIYTIW